MPPKGKVKKPVADDSWFKNQITVGNMISVGFIVAGFAGFYFNTSSTQANQSEKITALLQDRNALRSEMTDRAEKTAASIAELKQTNAVISTQLLAIRDDIVRLGAQIAAAGKIEPVAPRK